MTNCEKLRELIMEVFLLDPSEFHFNLMAKDVETWDSLGVVSLAVGIQEVFGYHLTPDEAIGIQGIPDIVTILRSRGIDFAV